MTSRRARARKYMISCSASHQAENFNSQQAVIDLLNEALATELICVLRYKANYYASHGFAAPDEEIKLADPDFLAHVAEEQRHVDCIAERIAQLGGTADFNPPILGQRGYSDYTNTGTLLDVLKEDLIAERIAIDIYHEMIRFVGSRDPITRDLLEDILAREEEHAEELASRIEALVATPVVLPRPIPRRAAMAVTLQ